MRRPAAAAALVAASLLFAATPPAAASTPSRGLARCHGRAAHAPRGDVVIGCHTVRAGQTLWSIAARYLGNGRKWPLLAKVNHVRARHLTVGMVLTIVMPCACTAAPPAKPKPRQLLVIGDSYAQGYAAAPGKGWATLVGEQLGWPTKIAASAGVGYQYPAGGANFQQTAERIITAGGYRPDVIVVEGFQNDWRFPPAQEVPAVVHLVTMLRTAYPKAQIVLFGSTRGADVNWTLGALERAVASAAKQLQVPFIDPLAEHWITPENTHQFIISDDTHPNTAGHAYIASRFLVDFRRLLHLS